MQGQTYRAAEQVVATKLTGGCAVLLDLETTFYFDLNPTGALIWDRLAEGSTAEEAAQALVQAFQVDEPRARRDTEALLAELLESALIVPHEGKGPA